MPLPEGDLPAERGPLQAVMLPKTVKETPSDDRHLLEEGPEPGWLPQPKDRDTSHPSETHGNN